MRQEYRLQGKTSIFKTYETTTISQHLQGDQRQTAKWRAHTFLMTGKRLKAIVFHYVMDLKLSAQQLMRCWRHKLQYMCTLVSCNPTVSECSFSYFTAAGLMIIFLGLGANLKSILVIIEIDCWQCFSSWNTKSVACTLTLWTRPIIIV